MIYEKTSNKLIRKLLCSFLGLIVCFPNITFAQELKDSVQLKKYQLINKKFPFAFPIDVQYTYYTPTKMTTKLLGKDYFSADICNQQTLSTSVNSILFMKKGFLIKNSFKYLYGTISFQNIDTTLYKHLTSYIKRAEKINVFSDAINIKYMGNAFGRKITLNLITTIDFSEYGYERTFGKLVASINIKENKRTSIYVGLIGDTDPIVTFPVAPLISISSWLSSKWLLDAYLPVYMYVRRIYDNNSRLSFGFNTHYGSQSYVHPDIPSVSSFTFLRRRMELASTYQKVLFDGLTLSTKVGYVINLKGKVLDTEKNDPLLILNQKPNLSFNVGLSYNFIPKKINTKIK